MLKACATSVASSTESLSTARSLAFEFGIGGLANLFGNFTQDFNSRKHFRPRLFAYYRAQPCGQKPYFLSQKLIHMNSEVRSKSSVV